MAESNYQERILDKLSEHSILLATIATEIKNLKTEDESLMEKIDRLELKVENLERLVFISLIVVGIMAAKLGFAYLLKV